MKNNFIDYDKFNKIEKSPSKAYLLWAMFSIILIFIPNVVPAIVWAKKLYFPSCFIFILATNIYMDYPVNFYVFGSKEEKRKLRKILGIDETLSEAEQEKHPLVKKIWRQFFCTLVCAVTMFITAFIVGIQVFVLR